MKNLFRPNYGLIILGIILFSSACTSSQPVSSPAKMNTPTPVQVPEDANLPTSSPTKRVTPKPGTSISDEGATRLMYQLLQIGDPMFDEAVDAILAADDTRFVPVFIELFRANQIG
ncbi:unnamed protein product, partial [marine sediment metagenome]